MPAGRELTLESMLDRIEHERELRKVAEEAAEKARQRQFDELERRLDDLSEVNSLSAESRRMSVSREGFLAYQKEVDRRLGSLEASQLHLAGQREATRSVLSWVAPNLGAALAIGFGIVALYLAVRGG